MLSQKEVETLRKTLSDDNLSYRYQQFIMFVAKANETGGLDEMEYKIFTKQNTQKDLLGLAHAYMNSVFTFEEYFAKITMIVGWDLMICGLMEGDINADMIK